METAPVRMAAPMEHVIASIMHVLKMQIVVLVRFATTEVVPQLAPWIAFVATTKYAALVHANPSAVVAAMLIAPAMPYVPLVVASAWVAAKQMPIAVTLHSVSVVLANAILLVSATQIVPSDKLV